MQLIDNFAYKTSGFKDPVYIGDPINTVKILNDKGADELLISDISAHHRRPVSSLSLVEQIASQAFMPVTFGGGVTSMDRARTLFSCGVEKLSFGSALLEDPDLVRQVSNVFGVQAVVASVDYRNIDGVRRVVPGGYGRPMAADLGAWLRRVEDLGAGEILLTDMEREGSNGGFDIEVLERFGNSVTVPLVAMGGAGTLDDFRRAIDAGASAVAAGTMFTFYGKHRAVLITYPDEHSLDQLFNLGTKVRS